MLNRGSEQPQSNPFQERRHVFMSLDTFRKNIKESLKNSRNGCFGGVSLFKTSFEDERMNYLHRLIGKYSQVRCWATCACWKAQDALKVAQAARVWALSLPRFNGMTFKLMDFKPSVKPTVINLLRL